MGEKIVGVAALVDVKCAKHTFCKKAPICGRIMLQQRVAELELPVDEQRPLADQEFALKGLIRGWAQQTERDCRLIDGETNAVQRYQGTATIVYLA